MALLSLFSQLSLVFSQPQALHAFTGYAVEDILPCLTDLHKLHMSAESRPQQAIREKFKSSKYGVIYGPILYVDSC